MGSRLHSKATLISSSRVQVPSQARADLLPIQVPAIPAHIIHMGRRAVLPIMQDIMPVPSMRRRVLMARRCRMGAGTHSKIAAGLLGIFLGTLGVHNFYLGYTGKAVAQLLLTVIGWIIIIGPFVSAIWSFVEGIIILCSNPGSPWHRDAAGYELRD